MKDSGRDYFDLKELHDAGVIDLMPKGKEAVRRSSAWT